MAKKLSSLPLDSWSVAIGATSEQIKTAWDDLQRRGLAVVKGGKHTVSPLALRRANSAVERTLAAHLSGFLLTENSFIVRQAGAPPGSPSILNTRITVEHIANYFKDGWGVPDIQRDLPQLLREDIEAAIQYYLNHREEIERDMRRSQEFYAAQCSQAGVDPDELRNQLMVATSRLTERPDSIKSRRWIGEEAFFHEADGG